MRGHGSRTIKDKEIVGQEVFPRRKAIYLWAWLTPYKSATTPVFCRVMLEFYPAFWFCQTTYHFPHIASQIFPLPNTIELNDGKEYM